MIGLLLQNGQQFIISGKSFLLPLVFLAIILIMMNSFGIQAYIMQDSIGRPLQFSIILIKALICKPATIFRVISRLNLGTLRLFHLAQCICHRMSLRVVDTGAKWIGE